MQIEKAYFTLPEILDRWQISEEDLIYLAENDELRLSVRVFDLAVEVGARMAAAVGDSRPSRAAPGSYSGLLDLHAGDVFQLFRCGELPLHRFRRSAEGEVTTAGNVEPVLVTIGDLLLRREERDRFEIACGFSAGGQPIEDQSFLHSADYLEVRCNGFRFKLGPIQAEVVRALHGAAQAGEPWQNGKAVLSQAGSRSLRMADVFKSQRDWRRLIRSDRRGGYRLNVG